MKARLSLSALLTIALVTPLMGQSLSDVERRIASEVDATAEEAIALLERTVNINSGSMNFDGVRENGVLFREEFDRLGFETEWVDGAAFAFGADNSGDVGGSSQSHRMLAVFQMLFQQRLDVEHRRFTNLANIRLLFLPSSNLLLCCRGSI